MKTIGITAGIKNSEVIVDLSVVGKTWISSSCLCSRKLKDYAST